MFFLTQKIVQIAAVQGVVGGIPSPFFFTGIVLELHSCKDTPDDITTIYHWYYSNSSLSVCVSLLTRFLNLNRSNGRMVSFLVSLATCWL